MAQFGIHGSWKSVAALASLFTFIGLLAYAVAGGTHNWETDRQVTYGLILYLLTFVIMFFGFWSKEDVIAILGIVGLSLLMILDVLLRVGVLSFNHYHVI